MLWYVLDMTILIAQKTAFFKPYDEIFGLIEAPSGIAITPGGEVIITIADYFGDTQHFGLFRYRVSDGQELVRIDLDFRPGDIDCDENGLIYLLAKVIDEWHVYTEEFEKIAGSPFGPVTFMRR